MLTLRDHQTGLSLAELLVGVVVMGILILAALPSMRAWIQSAQIRTAAETIQSGLQLAVNNAVTFNNPVQFVLTGTDSSWTIGCTTPGPNCPAAIQAHSGVEGSPNAEVAATQTTIVFNGLGRVTPPPGGNIVFTITNTKKGGACVPAGPMRCLNVQVSAGGDIRMCDPRLPAYPADPQGC